MTLTTFFVNRKIANFISFDTVIEEGHTRNYTITKNPTQTGFLFSDHVFSEFPDLKMQVMITDSPTIQQRLSSPLFNTVNRAQTAYEILRSLFEPTATNTPNEVLGGGQPFNIQTGLYLYQNMLCYEFKVIQNAQTVNCMIAELSFKQIQIVNGTSTFIPPRASGPVSEQGTAVSNRGIQQLQSTSIASSNISQTFAGFNN